MATINKLKDTAFRSIKPTETEQLLAYGGGLLVSVQLAKDGGAVWFRLAYRIKKKAKMVNSWHLPNNDP